MNQFSKQVLVKGVSFFADKIDGESINSGCVFIEEELDDRSGRARGFRTVEYRTPDSEIPKALVNLTFPVDAMVTFEIATMKRGQSIIVVGVKVQPRGANPAPMPKAA